MIYFQLLFNLESRFNRNKVTQINIYCLPFGLYNQDLTQCLKISIRNLVILAPLPPKQSGSKSKALKKQLIEVIYTDTTGLRTHKSKSLSRDKLLGRKSTQTSKISKKVLSQKNPSRTLKLKQNLLEKLDDNQRNRKNIFYDNIATEKAVQLKWSKKNSRSKAPHSVQRYRKLWEDQKIPINSEYVVMQFAHLLSKYELKEIRDFKKIYYVGHRANHRQKAQKNEQTFDNEEKQYNFVAHDHIVYRYEVLSLIGKGSYGQVFLVFDHKNKEELALKMIKNRQKFTKQAFNQIQILTKIKEQDSENCSNIIKIKDFVIFRRHVCLMFQRMSENLYQLIIRNNCNGLSIDLIRRFAIQMLVSLEFLRKNKIIHCDLKPENILLRQYHKSGIKLIDFGSSCFQNQTLYTYIQSRYYRAPQITLGIPYDTRIDLWSTGCILGQLYTGVPLFPGENQHQQMKYLTDTLGPPPDHVLDAGSRSQVFFKKRQKDGEQTKKQYQLRKQIQSLSLIEYFGKKLEQRIPDPIFREFLCQFLHWDPKARITPREALKNKWIVEGMPEHLRNNNMLDHHASKQHSGAQETCKTTRVSNIRVKHEKHYSGPDGKSRSKQRKMKTSTQNIKGSKVMPPHKY